MASTDEGRDLTRAHQTAQIGIAADAMVRARALWPLLDAEDLAGSTPRWLAATASVVEQETGRSQRTARVYLMQYRQAEIRSVQEEARVVLGRPASTVEALRMAGPVRIERLIAGGMDEYEAKEAAYRKFAGIVARQAQMGGRMTVAYTASADRRAVGWRRVTGSDPCAFCAMLAARGPVYKSRTSGLVQGEGLRYHGSCKCTAEIIYGQWAPEGAEVAFTAAYEKAAAEVVAELGRTDAKRILALMRRDGFR